MADSDSLLQESELEQNPLFLKLVDTREPEEIYGELLKAGWFRQKLNFGDFQFITHDSVPVIVSRKSWSDLLQSIGEVFAKQLDEILEFNPEGVNILLLEGKPQREMVSDRMMTSQGLSHYTYESVANWLRRWWDKGFTPEITFSVTHTIQRLNELYSFYQKPYSLSARSRKWTDDRVLAFPTYTRGATALKALAHFQSLEGVATAGVRQLQEVLGQKRGQVVYDHFHRR